MRAIRAASQRVIVGDSAAMSRLRGEIAKAACHDASVLVLGESGCGKELVTREIHRLSAASGAFVAVNCASLPEGLINVELFGHERGAYTGSGPARMGLFEAADRGTILLDEVGSMPMEQQGALLRVLEDREVRRVGAVRPIPVSFRVLASTNVELAHAINRGRFRPDLYYRLATTIITVPPLRDRLEDLPALCGHYLGLYGEGRSGGRVSVSVDAMEQLRRYPWPGNVRELQNVLQQACLTAAGAVIDGFVLPIPLQVDENRHALSLQQHERAHIAEALKYTGGNKSRAARLLGISRQTLYEKVERLRIPISGFSAEET